MAPKYRWFWFGTLALLAAEPGSAQSLSLSRPTVAPGDQLSIELSLKSPPGLEPSSLQWEMIVPYAQLLPLEENAPGPAARAAQKVENCAIKAKNEATYVSVCVLYGGQERIRNGIVAVLKLRVSPEAAPGSFRIRVTDALAVSPDAKQRTMDPVETIVTIRKNPRQRL